MQFRVTNKILFLDESQGTVMNQRENSSSFDWSYDGKSKRRKVRGLHFKDQEEEIDFEVSNVNKFVYNLKHGNAFSLNIQKDLIKDDSEIVSVHVFCYESNEFKPYKTPMRFDVCLGDSGITLASTCDFSLGNLKNLSEDIRIENINVPIDSLVNLVIILATKEY